MPATNTTWQKAIGVDWPTLDPWIKPIHTYLAHISWARRTLQLPEPPDEHEQRWPLLKFVGASLRVLDQYVEFVRDHTTLGYVVEALENVKLQAQLLWDERKQLIASEGVRP